MARSKRDDGESDDEPNASAFFWVIVQIIVIDMVFSLDSIITAIGMAQDIEIMIAAVVIACFDHVHFVRAGVANSSPSIRPPRCWRWRSWC